MTSKLKEICVAYYFPATDTDGIPNTLYIFPLGTPLPGRGDEVMVGGQMFTVTKREFVWDKETYDVILHLVAA